MGLDQFAYITTTPLNNINKIEEPYLTEVWYGRKINPLQGYFERNYDMDNCEFVPITKDNLDELEEFCKKDIEFLQKCCTEDLDDNIDILNLSSDQYEKVEAVLGTLSEDVVYDLHLPPQGGFFYGNYNVNIYYIGDLQATLHFVTEMRKQLKDLNHDEHLVYYSWY